MEPTLAYRLYPRADSEYLVKDFDLVNPSLVVFVVENSGDGDELCDKLEQPGVYSRIRDASVLDELKTDQQALERILPVLEELLGGSIKLIRAVGVLDGQDGLWLHLYH